MPFVFLAIGLIVIVAGVRGTEATLFALLKNDIQGFAPWFVAIITIGALGYIRAIRPITDGFMALLIVVLFLSNGGFFSKLFGSTSSTASVGTSATSGSLTGATLSPLTSLNSLSALSTSST